MGRLRLLPLAWLAVLFLVPLHLASQDEGQICLPYSAESEHVLFGRPAGTPGTNDLVIREPYELSSNDGTKFADWVAYVLDGSTFDGPDRSRNYRPDPCIDSDETLENDDYEGAYAQYGYDRGHLAPLATFGNSPHWDEVNYLSNITPQHRTLNRGAWARLEASIRDSVRGGWPAYVLTGTIYEETVPALPNADEAHRVPSDYWKIVAIGDPTDPASVQATAFLFDQQGCVVEGQCTFDSDFRANRVAVDVIERLSAEDMVRTDLDFFPDLPSEVEASLESRVGPWPLREPTAPATPVRLTRLFPNPVGKETEPEEEWIEVCNQESTAVEVSGWRLTDGEGSYTYPAGRELAPAGADGDCLKVYGVEYNPTGSTQGLYLSNSGEEVILRDSAGNEVDRCEYGDTDEGEVVHCE